MLGDLRVFVGDDRLPVRGVELGFRGTKYLLAAVIDPLSIILVKVKHWFVGVPPAAVLPQVETYYVNSRPRRRSPRGGKGGGGGVQ